MVAVGKRFNRAFGVIVLGETSAVKEEQSRISAPKSEGEGDDHFDDHVCFVGGW